MKELNHIEIIEQIDYQYFILGMIASSYKPANDPISKMVDEATGYLEKTAIATKECMTEIVRLKKLIGYDCSDMESNLHRLNDLINPSQK